MSDLTIRLWVSENGDLGTLILFELEEEGKQFSVYYDDYWENMEKELRAKGFPEHVIMFVYGFLRKYGRIVLESDGR
ncbi:hypothetical protein OCC_02977 [Thermococcus litoralis DSM 5473]|uniref:Uncharacterized protein n=1 Tax=Thermococcus litoralis (strain ATCC 51850 / DSM 5473 / JCM 8560 / NS-C) TaxID=523849 RepID=H3ZQ17_THELN|nr:hypothetical protein OCC_02977 [Thermococcus litoralis DSM 5473]